MTSFEYTDLLNTIDGEGGHLETINTTSERNGYPRQVKDAITGFKTFDEAKAFAQENGLELICIDRKDGWDLWHRGNHAFEPFNNYGRALQNDELECYCKENADAYFKSFKRTLKNMLSDDVFNIYNIKCYCENCDEIYDAIRSLSDHEFLAKSIYNNDYEVLEKATMTLDEDNKHFAIAAICTKFDEDEEDL